MKKNILKLISHSVKVWMLGSLLFTAGSGLLYASPQDLATPLLAPAFSSVALNGKSVNSAQLAGKAYIVNFFASWCPPCRAEVPDMVALQSKYGSKGFTFIGVGFNDKEASIRDFTARNAINYPVFMANEKLASSFAVLLNGGKFEGIPTSFVVNSSGKVTQIILGGRSKEVFESIILELLKKPVSVK